MNLIKKLLFAVFILSSGLAFAKGGEEKSAAYQQSVKILTMATTALEDKILNSTLKDLVDHPERRNILQDTLGYDDLKKLPWWNQYSHGKKLEMNHSKNPSKVIILKPYYEAFAGKMDSELDASSLEVQKRLLREAALIWGYKEAAAETFAISFLKNDDIGHGPRPTNSIDIKSDFCSCLNGKSDIINDCENFCAAKPVSDQPILYVNTILGTDITLNPKLGNLYNWCSVQLQGDDTTPQCMLNATDGTNTLNLPVTVTPGSNSFTSSILALSKDRTWVLKLVEAKTGSNAQSREFQIRRKSPHPDQDTLGALKVTPVSQYTCMTYGGIVNSTGSIVRTTFARVFYYFAANETPPPMPAVGGTNQSLVVCHDEQLHPGNDSALYDRLELIPGALAMWDKSDTRFIAKPENAGKLTINKILEERLASEYGITGSTINLFNLISFPNRPTTSSTSTANNPLGYIMVPFTNTDTGKSYCPTSTDYNGNQPLLNLLGEYMDDTEGLFLGEKEAETVLDGGSYKTIYGTMFVRESTLLNYGFYIENGMKIKADSTAMNTKTIYYYWPVSPYADPMSQGNRKLFTVRTYDTLNGNVPTGQSPTERTTDKRIGCVPRI